MIRFALFDLDGTLLPMDQEIFTKAYLKRLSEVMAPHGYEAHKLISTIWAGMEAMVKNDGSRTNFAAFWDAFISVFGTEAANDIPKFDAFYLNEFQSVREVCGFQPKSAALISRLHECGIRTVLATNPIFPPVATNSRIRWAGMEPDDFELITTYDNSTHCKPNPEYYRDILTVLNAKPSECIMVGNDAYEDMAAADIGIEVFLLTDHLINTDDIDISQYPHGDFDALMRHLGV